LKIVHVVFKTNVFVTTVSTVTPPDGKMGECCPLNTTCYDIAEQLLINRYYWYLGYFYIFVFYGLLCSSHTQKKYTRCLFIYQTSYECLCLKSILGKKHHGITFHSHLVGRCDVNDNKSLDSTSISNKLLKIFYWMCMWRT
jgi:hypothetical protein